MNRKMAVLLLTLGSILTLAPAAKAFDLAVLANMNVGNTSYSTLASGFTPSTATGWGVGVLFTHDLFPTVRGEFGVIEMTRGGTLNAASGGASTTSYTYLTVPYLFRFEPISLISVGVGPYFAYGIGNVTLTSSNPALLPSVTSYESQNQSRTDLGLMASASIKLPLVPMLSFRGDINYAYGFTNLNPLNPQSFRDLIFMAGLSLGL